MEKLFTEFDPATPQQWKDQLVKDLKGVDPAGLTWHTDNGFDVKPFYTREDLVSPAKPLFAHSDWQIGELIMVSDEHTANREAIGALNGGASCLKFCLSGDHDIFALLEGIYIEHIAIEFMITDEVEAFESQFRDLMVTRNLRGSDLTITINYDVIAHLAEHGNWLNNQKEDLGDFLKASKLYFNEARVLVDATLYQETGASQVTELAMILSHYNEYLNFLSEAGFDLQELKKGVQVSVSVGTDFFAEIAKLRALRELMALVNKEYGFEAPLFISCTTSHLTLSTKDAYTNLLRGTTQAMSAVIGGCGALYVTPFDELYQDEANGFARRMARNQQLILKEESYLDKAADIGAGSYYIDSLTEQMASQAFELFKSWEAQGGLIACLQKGTIQAAVKAQAERLKEKAAKGELVIIGANKYINPKDTVSSQVKVKPFQDPDILFEPLKPIRLAEPFEQGQETLKN